MHAPRRKSRALHILLILLLLVIIAIACYYLWRAYKNNTEKHPLPPAAPAPSTESASRPALLSYHDLVFAGLPQTPASVTILDNIGYISGYSETRRDPLFVAYHVFEHDHAETLKRPESFEPDPRSASAVSSKDYTGSGYDRGHMAPNHVIAACYGRDAQIQTFRMTNVCPQTATLNQKVWEALEHLEAEVYPHKFGDLWVIDGPIFSDNPKTIGLKKVQVPVAFYKILIENKSGPIHTLSIIMPQTVVESDRDNLKKFLVPIREIESKTGLNFFPDLPREERDKIETAQPEMWKTE